MTPTSTPVSTSALSPASMPTAEKSIDSDHNGVINMSDVILVAKAFNKVKGTTGYVEEYDLNSD